MLTKPEAGQDQAESLKINLSLLTEWSQWLQQFSCLPAGNWIFAQNQDLSLDCSMWNVGVLQDILIIGTQGPPLQCSSYELQHVLFKNNTKI